MGERAKTTRENLDEFDTPEWRAANTWVWRNAPHGGTRYQDAKLRYQTAVARIAALEVQIRGHCALLTGGTTHTENPTDCLGQVQEFAATLEAERDEARQRLGTAVALLEACDIFLRIHSGPRNELKADVQSFLGVKQGPASDGGAGS